ncbi:MAG: hypothetical protein ACLQNE_34690 [Thermoguttaceae bacterium]
MQALRFGRSGNLPASSMARLGLVAPLLVVLSYAVHTSDAAGGTTLSAPQASGVRGPSAAQDAKSQDAEPGEVEISDQDPRMETEEYIIHTGPLTVSIFGHRPVKPFDVAATPTALPSHAKQATVPQTEAAQETHGDPSGMNRPMRLSAAAVQTALTQRLFELHAAGPNPAPRGDREPDWAEESPTVKATYEVPSELPANVKPFGAMDLLSIQGRLRELFPDSKLRLVMVDDRLLIEGQAESAAESADILDAARLMARGLVEASASKRGLRLINVLRIPENL